MSEILESTEWKQATQYQITDEDIERGKLLLGVDVANGHREYIQTATYDAIRNFTLGTGNDNPLFCDPDYARGTRWGDVIAPGMMVGTMNKPMRGDPMPADIKARTKSLFKGVHVFVSGSDWTWYRPIYPGDTVYSFSGQESLDVKQSEFAGRSVIRVNRHVNINQRGEVVAVYRVLMVLTERQAARSKGKYAELKPATYTDEDMAKIDEIYAAEQVRGATPRYWEDVSIGESLGLMAKGPLTVTDVMCFHAGGYGFHPYAPTVGRLAHQNRKRIPAFYVKNEQGVPDVAQRLHWDPVWAQAIGNPMAYDYGVMRENYIYHYLTDWCGDDGIVVQQHDEVRKFNYMGDNQIISGEVTGKRQEDGRFLVDVAIKMVNQRDEETVRATATIALPARTGALATAPAAPFALEQRAQGFMAHHWRLSAGRQA
jgi:acyl dehydratase